MKKSMREVLANNIRSLMAGHPNMTITSLAKTIGMSRSQLNNIVTQKSATTIDTLEKLAAVFEINPFTLLYSFQLDIFESEELAMNLHVTPGPRDADLTLAIRILADSFAMIDDEGRFAMLRQAALESGDPPDLEGIKLPRDWRDFARDLIEKRDWYTEE